MLIVPRKQKGDSKRPQSSVLGIGLFVVADVFDELFDGDGFAVLELVAAGFEAGLVDEDVGVCCEARDVAGGVLA